MIQSELVFIFQIQKDFHKISFLEVYHKKETIFLADVLADWAVPRAPWKLMHYGKSR